MKRSGLLSFGAVALLFAAGGARVCSAQSCQGVWTGMAVSGNASGSAAVEADLCQTGASVGGTARVTEASIFHVGAVNGSMTTCADLNMSLGTFGQMNTTLNLSGSNAWGTYQLVSANGSVVDSGTIALTKQSGVTTANVQGIYWGNGIGGANGSAANGATLFLMQTGNNLYVSTAWNGFHIYNGTGTVIGNKITFQLNQINWITGTPNIMFGTATINGGVISGIDIVSSPGNSQAAAGAYTVNYGMAIH